jgi:excisionase family DNA binding protein
MSFSLSELRGLHYCVRVADSVLPQDHPSREHLPVLLGRVETEISRTRNESDCLDGQLKQDKTDRIGTAEAAQIIGCTQRRVQQKIAAGEISAEKVSGHYVLRRKDIAA